MNSIEQPIKNCAPSENNRLGLSFRGFAIRPWFVCKKSLLDIQPKAFKDVEDTCGKDQGDHSDDPSNLQQTRNEYG